MRNDYNTKQRNMIIDFLRNSDNHITALNIVNELNNAGEKISRATVYRQLERLIDAGIIRKYITDNGACYQYAQKDCNNHFHLKCTHCGTLLHIECDYMKDLAPHILQHHGFTVDNTRTVMYGICQDCRKEKSNE